MVPLSFCGHADVHKCPDNGCYRDPDTISYRDPDNVCYPDPDNVCYPGVVPQDPHPLNLVHRTEPLRSRPISWRQPRFHQGGGRAARSRNSGRIDRLLRTTDDRQHPCCARDGAGGEGFEADASVALANLKTRFSPSNGSHRTPSSDFWSGLGMAIPSLRC